MSTPPTFSTLCAQGIARLEARPPVDLEMLERGMDQLTKALPPRQPAGASAAPQRSWWLLLAVSTGCVLVGILAGWQVPRWTETATRRQVHLLEQMDTVLRQSWGTVPAAVRESLTTLYKQAGYQPPADPKKGK